MFGLRGASYCLGASEWLTAALLIWGFWSPRAGTLGALLSVGTFVTTVTIIPFMPDGWDAAAGFPAMKGNVAFLMKDFVLLTASFYLLKQDVARVVDSRDAGAAQAGDRPAVEAVPWVSWAGAGRPLAARRTEGRECARLRRVRCTDVTAVGHWMPSEWPFAHDKDAAFSPLSHCCSNSAGVR